MNRSFAAPVAALLVVAGLAAPAAMAAPEPPRRVEHLTGEHVPGEVVVRYSARTDAAERAEVRGEHDLDRVESLGLPNTEVVEVEQGTVTETVAALTDDPSVVFAEPNYVYRAFGTPDDPQFQDLWALHQASDVDVDAPQAWDLTTGSPAVTVAVVDTGVAVDHPELAPNVWQNPGESGGGKESNHVDDDDNGYVDDYRGWDWVGDDRHPRDLHGHGTHVAGTIGARGNDGAGIAGVSWGSKIMALRALNSGGEGNTGDLASAFTYAARNGAKVVNVSLGGANYSLAVLNAITAAPDTLFVVAAGNAGANNDLGSSYPCNYPLPNIVCVAATDSSDQLASYSNYGATSVDLAAPGSGILSLQPAIVTRFWEDFGTDPTGRWTPGGATGTWARDPGGFVSDSPGGNYSDNADHSLALSSPFDLTGMNDCLVRYALKLDVEEGHDELVVEASTNGTDWTRAGAWTGSSGGEWTGVTDSLFAYDGRPSVYLRFRLLSNGSVTADGASIDNVGVRCYSTSFTGSELMWASGTSMAAPHVAGVAALAWSAAPDAPVAAVARALIDGADDTAAMAGKSVAGGRLNACATVALVAGASPAACTDATSAATASPKPATAPTHTPTPAPSPEPSASPTPSPSPTPSATPAPTPGPTPTSSPAPTPETTPSPEPAPDPGPQRPDPVVHDRIVKLRMEPGLVARGRVRAPDGYDACKSEVLVKIVRNGRVVARLTTRSNGRFRVKLEDRPGRYVARAPETSPDPTTVCSSAASKTRRV